MAIYRMMKTTSTALLVWMLSLSVFAEELAQSPGFTEPWVGPNVVLQFDDSASMNMGFLMEGADINAPEGADTASFFEGLFDGLMDTIFGDDCDRGSGTDTYIGQEFCTESADGKRYLLSTALNEIYFNPDVDYKLPPCPQGWSRCEDGYLPEPNFVNAPVDGYEFARSGPSAVERVNLSSNYRAIMDHQYFNGKGFTINTTDRIDCGWFCMDPRPAQPAFYMEWNPNGGCSRDSRNDLLNDSCYAERQVSAEQRRNFARWFSYYRNRLMTSKAAVGLAFETAPPEVRAGWSQLSYDGNDQVMQAVDGFMGDHRENFYEWLYTIEAEGTKPLRTALSRTGLYYEDNANAFDLECRASHAVLMTDGYWGDKEDGWASASMRANAYGGVEPKYDYANEIATLALSDGGQNATDELEPLEPEGRVLTAFAHPDSSVDNTLADVAASYWSRDLMENLENKVPIRPENRANWQHMVTHGAALGVIGNFKSDQVEDWIAENADIAWGNPHVEYVPTCDDISSWLGRFGCRFIQGITELIEAIVNTIDIFNLIGSGEDDEEVERLRAKIDDLMRASYLSGGGFFAANEPTEFAEGFIDLLVDLVANAGSASGIGVDAGAVESDGLAYNASYDANNWTGDITALRLSSITEGAENADPQWRASQELENMDPDDRNIITRNNSGGGVAFRNLDDLPDIVRSDLEQATAGEASSPADVLAFLRGDRYMEGRGLRQRNGVLGSIVHSTPLHVGEPRSNWPNRDPFGQAGNRFQQFQNSENGRDSMVYAGANDGMFHAFDANTGKERFAYIPGFVFSSEDRKGLHNLALPDYRHRYYVDLEPTVQDVFIRGRNSDGSLSNSADWRTIVVGGGRAGAQGLFALDVTDPDRFENAESDPNRLALWEFTAADSDDMGYVIKPPIIAMADWGDGDHRWTAFFGNGYENAAATTGFYMLDIENGIGGNWERGENYRFIEFSLPDGVESPSSPQPGLSPVTVVDLSRDGVADRLYAGDREGNLWVAGSTSDGWEPVDGGLLFSAEDANGLRQPITAAPSIGDGAQVNRSSDLMVFVGTGQYLYEDDIENSSGVRQSFYGILDSGSMALQRDDLAERGLTTDRASTQDGEEFDVRLVNEDAAVNFADNDGWYIDLTTGDGTSGTGDERIIEAADVRGDVVYVDTILAEADPCSPGGTGWVMALSFDGMTPRTEALPDFDQPIAGFRLGAIPTGSTIVGNFRITAMHDDTNTAYQILDQGEEPPTGAGRRGWREIFE